MISQNVIVCLFISLALVVAIPVTLIIVWSKKTKPHALTYVIGAASFLVFALILESIMHSFCLVNDNPVSRAINSTPVLYVAYGSLAAGIFEETGRFICFKLFSKKIFTEKKTSVAYGIGHGGFEALILTGVTLLNMIANILMLNSIGAQQFVLLAGETQKETLETVLQSLLATSSADGFIMVWERVSAIALHICLSVLVYIAAKDKKKVWLYPTAILLHAAFNIAPCLYQKGLISSIILVEVIIFAVAVAVSFITVHIYRKYQNEPCE